MAENKKQSPLFAFCEAVRTGFTRRKNKKQFFVFAQKVQPSTPADIVMETGTAEIRSKYKYSQRIAREQEARKTIVIILGFCFFL